MRKEKSFHKFMKMKNMMMRMKMIVKVLLQTDQ